MKTLTQQLRESGFSKTEIHKYLQRLNRAGFCAYDIERITLLDDEIWFHTYTYGGMIFAYKR